MWDVVDLATQTLLVPSKTCIISLMSERGLALFRSGRYERHSVIVHVMRGMKNTSHNGGLLNPWLASCTLFFL